MVAFVLFIFVLFFLLNRMGSVISSKFKYIVIGVISLYWGFALINAPDIEGYMYCYNIIGTNGNPYSSLSGFTFHQFEPGFIYYMSFVKKCVDSYYFFQFISFVIELGLTYYGINKLLNEESTTLKIMLAFALNFTLFMSAMRQGIAIALFICSLPFALERQYLKTLGFICVGFLFHRSIIIAFLFILLYWIIINKRENFCFNKWITISLFLLCNIIYFSGYSLSNGLSFISQLFIDEIDLAGDRNYSTYAETLSGKTNYGILKVIELDFCYIVIFFNKKFRNKTEFNLLYLLFLVYFVLNLSIGGMLIHRTNYFLVIPYYVVLFLSLDYFFHNKLNLTRIASKNIILGYIVGLFFIQKIISSNYIFEYHLFDFII